MNENLPSYFAQDEVPVIIAPDSICYDSKHCSRGLSNASDDRAPYLVTQSGAPVSRFKNQAAEVFVCALGVLENFALLRRRIGYGDPLSASS